MLKLQSFGISGRKITISVSFNVQFRTGTDKGNPTV